MAMQFVDRSNKEDIPDEETIRAILAKIGKNGPEDELNCGSVSYTHLDVYKRQVFVGVWRSILCDYPPDAQKETQPGISRNLSALSIRPAKEDDHGPPICLLYTSRCV